MYVRCGETCARQNKVIPLLLYDKIFSHRDGTGLGKSVWKNHRSVFQDHVKYIHNDIVKPFIFFILQYAEHFHRIHNLENYLPPPSMKGK